MRLSSLAALLSLVPFFVVARDAAACGASFGRDTALEPAQTLVVAYANGEERYTLNPNFCGKGAEFGLVLPVPAPPSKPVVLGDTELVGQLDDLSAPTVVTTKHRYCPSGSSGDSTALGGAPNRAGGTDGEGTKAPGVNVVDAGKVGFLDYEVIKADSQTSLTDYLDQNAFPYDQAARTAFSDYVSRGFYFVAFKFSASTVSPASGQKICGSLGPLVVSFPATKPTIPSRIVTGDLQQRWRIYAIADENRDPTSNAANFTLSTTFRGAISTDDLGHYPALAAFARAGQRITRHEVQFVGNRSPGDLTLSVSSSPKEDYRTTTYVTESIPDESVCGGCSVVSPEKTAPSRTRTPEGLLATLLVGLSIALAKRRTALAKNAGRTGPPAGGAQSSVCAPLQVPRAVPPCAKRDRRIPCHARVISADPDLQGNPEKRSGKGRGEPGGRSPLQANTAPGTDHALLGTHEPCAPLAGPRCDHRAVWCPRFHLPPEARRRR